VAAPFGRLVTGGFDVAFQVQAIQAALLVDVLGNYLIGSSRVPKQLKVHSIQFAFHLPSVQCSQFLVT